MNPSLNKNINRGTSDWGMICQDNVSQVRDISDQYHKGKMDVLRKLTALNSLNRSRSPVSILMNTSQ